MSDSRISNLPLATCEFSQKKGVRMLNFTDDSALMGGPTSFQPMKGGRAFLLGIFPPTRPQFVTRTIRGPVMVGVEWTTRRASASDHNRSFVIRSHNQHLVCVCFQSFRKVQQVQIMNGVAIQVWIPDKTVSLSTKRLLNHQCRRCRLHSCSPSMPFAHKDLQDNKCSTSFHPFHYPCP